MKCNNLLKEKITMKMTKWLGIALVGALMSANAVMAQDNANLQRGQKMMKDPQEMAQKRVEHMQKSLGLNDQQAAQVKQLQVNMIQDRRQMNEQMRGLHKDFREKMRANNEQMKRILTPDQYKKYASNMRRHRDKMMYRMGKRMGMREGMERHGNGMGKDNRNNQQPVPYTRDNQQPQEN